MVYIYKDDNILTKSDTRCALSRADFSRQRDCYKLALRKDPQCRRLWSEFEQQEPQMARLVVADVESEKAKDQAANRHLDKVLVKSERKKLSKSAKRAIMQTPPLTAEQNLEASLLRTIATTADPFERESCRAALAERRRPGVS